MCSVQKGKNIYKKYIYNRARGPTEVRFCNRLVVSSIGGNTIFLYLQRKNMTLAY